MMVSTNVIKVAICVLAVKCIQAASTLIDSPQSTTKYGGETAVFSCAGNGTSLLWLIDEYPPGTQQNIQRGIREFSVTGTSTIQSNLTIPATTINNGTIVECGIFAGTLSVASDVANATLTVLPGIGMVRELKFNAFFDEFEVMWKKPLTAGVSDDQLQYNLTVTNLNINSVIVYTTTNKTNHSVYYPEPCTRYQAIVIPFVYDYLTGESVSATQKLPGEFYDIVNIVTDVADVDDLSTFDVILRIDLMLEGLSPCPGQKLIYQTHPQSNISDIVNHTEVVIEKDQFQYNVSSEFERKQLYTAIISRISDEGNIEVWMLNFSTFDIQDCNVYSDHSSILVECTTINSTTPGFVVIQDEQGHIVSKILQRLDNDTKGSANITGLSSGEYTVTVFDQMEDNNPAYKNKTVLYKFPSTPTPTPTLTVTVSTDGNIVQTTSTPEDSPLVAALSDSTNIIIIISTVLGSIILALVLVLVIVIVIVIIINNRRKGYNLDSPVP